MSRVRLRKLLMTGIDVNWGKTVSGFKPVENGISVSFTDGTEVQGSLLAAADGSGSKIRQLLVGKELGRLNHLPAHFLAVTVRLAEEKVIRLPGLDSSKLQGSHPDTGYYMWYSILSTPEVNGSSRTDSPFYEAQFDFSWLVHGPEDDMPPTNAGRLAKIKSLASAGTGFQKTLRDAVESIPDDTEVLEFNLSDWPIVPWHGFDGRVTLLGDAAHPMTMCAWPPLSTGLESLHLPWIAITNRCTPQIAVKLRVMGSQTLQISCSN